MSEPESFWPSCLAVLEQESPPFMFKSYLKPLSATVVDGHIRLIAPNSLTIQLVKDKFMARIEAFAATYFEDETEIELSLEDKRARVTSEVKPKTVTPQAPEFKAVGSSHETSRLNPNHVFDNLVVGKSNQLARAAAMQIAEHPGTAYNPLFIYGCSGLGKTHLIQAIGNQVQQNNPRAKVRYVKAERYVHDVVSASRNNTFNDLRKYYSSLDVLLIDDIHFFKNKERTQEEFFYTFNELVDSHKQVIITCDTLPKEIPNMEPRLVSRFGWGLTVQIDPPELEMRVAILQKKAESAGFHLSENVAFFIAQHIRSNVRELEGALKKVSAYSQFSNSLITIELARDALKDIIAVENRQISVESIQKTVADFFHIKVADILSRRRTRNLARPRQIAMSLTRELTQMSLPNIGEAFGGRDHTTVLHACDVIKTMRESDSQFQHDYETLLLMLRK